MSDNILNKDVASIFSVRIANALKAEEVYIIADLLSKTEKDLFITPNIGVGSIKIIKEFLQQHNLFLKGENEIQEDEIVNQNEIINQNKLSDLDLIQETTDLILKYKHLDNYEIQKAIEYANNRASIIINKEKNEKDQIKSEYFF